MSRKPKTLDEMTSGFLKFLGEAESLDDLRDAGVDPKLLRSLEAKMLSKGLDPERPEDLQAMFVHMVDTVYPRLMN